MSECIFNIHHAFNKIGMFIFLNDLKQQSSSRELLHVI